MRNRKERERGGGMIEKNKKRRAFILFSANMAAVQQSHKQKHNMLYKIIYAVKHVDMKSDP